MNLAWWSGELAQLAERVLSMHEVAGSIPAFSSLVPSLTVYVGLSKKMMERGYGVAQWVMEAYIDMSQWGSFGNDG